MTWQIKAANGPGPIILGSLLDAVIWLLTYRESFDSRKFLGIEREEE